MGRKKRRPGSENERIYCYYCDRDFASEHELVHHQKEKHLRCPTCHKRMVSTSGLVVHSMQVHKRTVTTVPNAIEGRDNPKIDVFGMRGIPEDEPTKNRHSKRYRNGEEANSAPVVSASDASLVSALPDVPPPSFAVPHSMYPHCSQPVPFVSAQYPQSMHLQQPFHQAHMMPGTQPMLYPYPYQDHLPYPSATHVYGQAPYYHSSQPRSNGTPWNARAAHPSSRPLRDRPVINPMPHAPRIHAAALPPAIPANVALAKADAVGVQNQTPSLKTDTTAGGKIQSKQVIIVFARNDVSMEELRAQLPRYKVVGKELNSTQCSASAVESLPVSTAATVTSKGE